MSHQTFDDFVNKEIQKQKDDAVDWPAELKKWLVNLSNLYGQVELYLEKYTSDGRVIISYDTTMLREDYIGTYQVRVLMISIGTNTIRLAPIGTLLIGAKGRVDMIGPKKSVRLILVPDDASEPKFKVTVKAGGGNHRDDPREAPPKNWVWKISTPPPKIKYSEIDEKNFYDVMMDVING